MKTICMEPVSEAVIRRFLREALETYPQEVGNPDLVDWPRKLATFSMCFGIHRQDGSLAAALFAYLNDKENNIAYIPFVCVLPECEKGTAYRLHEAYKDQARELGMRTLRLEVVKSNVHAYRFYLRQGYVVVEDRVERNRLLMELVLGD